MSLPRISAVIMAWSPRMLPYLELCLRSLRGSDYPAHLIETVVVAPSSYASQLELWDTDVRIVTPPAGEQFTAAQGYNYGYSVTSPDSRYILTLNDDVALTEGALRQLVTTAESLDNKLSLTNGISPCDRGVTSILDFPVRVGDCEYLYDQQYARLEHVAAILPELLKAKSAYPPGLIVSHYLCMYATLISRSLYEKIGGVDEKFENGPDDIDYCWRAQAEGGVCIMDLHAVIWHFGEVTKEACGTQDTRRWLRNMDYFSRKWGRLPPGVTANRYNFTLENLRS